MSGASGAKGLKLAFHLSSVCIQNSRMIDLVLWNLSINTEILLESF